MFNAIEFYKLEFLGGDLNEGNEIVIDVFMFSKSNFKITRKINQNCVLVTKPNFGYTGIFLNLLYLNKIDYFINDNFFRKCFEYFRKPIINLQEIDSLINLKNYVIASMDSSDGLGDVLWTFARLNNAYIEVYRLPTDQEVIEFCKQNNLDVLNVIFNGGEEYIPVFAIPENAIKYFRELGFVDFAKVIIGQKPQVVYNRKKLEYYGWEYFKS